MIKIFIQISKLYILVFILLKISKKEKLIIFFSGKLNTAKGFDKFSNAIINILNKYKDWNSIVMGDEPREKYNYNHKNLNSQDGYLRMKVLKIYNKSSITIVPSLWKNLLEDLH